MPGKRITEQQKCQIKTDFFIYSTLVEHGRPLAPAIVREAFLPAFQTED